MSEPLTRRTFVGLMGAAVALPSRLDALLPRPRSPLYVPPTVGGQDLTLTAREAVADYGTGRGSAWTLNGSVPAPTIRLQRGETARILLENGLPEETILHWHGLNVPEAADGHPRLAIGPGETYAYEFEVLDRAGLYWYHPHTHQRTAAQTYRGMAGLLVVEDEEERALRLPSGEFELPLVLQDKRIGGGNAFDYRPGMGPDVMLGYLGDTPFTNGTADATVEVRRGVYRLRLLNGSNARIFDVGLSSGDPMTLIGTDGGLLGAPATVDRVMMATGERADLLVNFSRFEEGDRIVLRSFPFEIPGMMQPGMGMGRGRGMGRRHMEEMKGGAAQGAEMDLLEFVVTGEAGEEARPLPDALSRIERPRPAGDGPRRSFVFTSRMMVHTIDGRPFEMERVDARVALGEPEIWTLINDSPVPHPVHVHAGQFRILGRSGGRGRIMPWETGLKDTVLLWPGEEVDISVAFNDYRGLFLLHCHNLDHEDQGMMANFMVE